MFWWLSVTHNGRLLSWINVWVSSSFLLPIQASQNEDFPFWKTLEVVSQPVNEWKMAVTVTYHDHAYMRIMLYSQVSIFLSDEQTLALYPDWPSNIHVQLQLPESTVRIVISVYPLFCLINSMSNYTRICFIRGAIRYIRIR